MAATPYDADDNWDEGEQLDLARDERLPWLESGEEDEGAGGFATQRLMLMGALAVLVLAVLVGGIWFVSNKASDEPEADGSLIAAPEQPYKTRPAEKGGKVFEGTGDSSFAVGEGEVREGKLADKPASAAVGPSIASTLDEGPRPTKPVEIKQPTAPQATGGAAVQVGAFPRREDAEAAWSNLLRQTEALSGVGHRVIEAQVDIGRVYRLQAVAGDRAAADRLCDALKADGLACFVK